MLSQTACSTADGWRSPFISTPSSSVFIGGLNSLKLFGKQVLIPLICTFAFAIPFIPATYAVDGCSSAGFKVATSVNLEATPFGMAVGDFNGDGHLDLVVAPNNGSGEVILLLG